jgi:hypothetical protein
MNINEHTTPEKLIRYAFLWSLARMMIASLSLFLSATPIAYRFLGSSAYSLLPLFWLISGAASVYLVYVWYARGQKLFGGNDPKDRIAFFILVVTGINLGFAALSYGNIGMNIVWGMPIADIIYKLTAIVYIIAAYYLFKRWKEHHEQLFV